ncbi:Mu transposase C-terminal domain-containing protein [Streptosporangium sp. NBC_01756]|uniref:Mu transposase C-terminal domain-containing protein n=1 Tax=Streptosporangium sp. NBC_01756 TaxID=2975950 RepID=UPI002DD80478|nr:Mu transposase C-terminal domain-containing protein [Streptosporangium sp. NBC_01756]WSC89499.1 Mu transposase C-terminal domain-containing protein [Streptosporangium sp. NBC_01756]
MCTVAKPRKVHTDGIQFLALRYIDPVLADYVGEQVTIRYDPRDITEIRVYLRQPDGTDDTFLCRAICPELSGETIGLKEITAARNALNGHGSAAAPEVDDVLAVRAVMYTPKVHSTPDKLDKEISLLCDRLGRTVDLMLQTGRGNGDSPPPGTSSTGAELLIVDEADRLKTAGLEQLRDHHDRTGIGVILIGMPGIEKRLARYSRVGFIHHYKPLSADEQAHVLDRKWPHLGLGVSDDFATTEAIAAITRITSGNFRLVTRLVDQIERVLEINQLTTVTKEVVEAARENLIIGVM